MIKVDQYAWASGFYEGEGNVSLGQRGGINISVSQVNQEPLIKLMEIFGGKIYGPYLNKGPNDKPYYVYYLSTHEAVSNFIWKIIPWLSEKKAKELLDKLEFKINMIEFRAKYCRNFHPRDEFTYISNTGKVKCRKCISISKKKQYNARKKVESVGL